MLLILYKTCYGFCIRLLVNGIYYTKEAVQCSFHGHLFSFRIVVVKTRRANDHFERASQTVSYKSVTPACYDYGYDVVSIHIVWSRYDVTQCKHEDISHRWRRPHHHWSCLRPNLRRRELGWTSWRDKLPPPTLSSSIISRQDKQGGGTRIPLN